MRYRDFWLEIWQFDRKKRPVVMFASARINQNNIWRVGQCENIEKNPLRVTVMHNAPLMCSSVEKRKRFHLLAFVSYKNMHKFPPQSMRDSIRFISVGKDGSTYSTHDSFSKQ